jgi:predicted regulator of Ras-like GTPase activity (Roadblock/LC7/MglB family)
MTPPKESTSRAEGFEGSIAGLGLPDVIQLNGINGFSGCITVQHGESMGRIFFREGRIIHAEQGGRSGCEAFYDILEWRSGRFSLEPNVSTTSHTIDMNSQHLLMEAHRVIDERRAGRGAGSSTTAARAGAPAAGKNGTAALLEKVRGVPGVVHPVVMGKDGACVEDSTFEGEALAGKAAFVALVGNQLGAVFRSGPLRSAVVHAPARNMLLLAGRNHYLSVLIEGGAEVGSVEADIRKLLG